MQIRCPRCKELSELEVSPVVGQHIVCPFCFEKFSYSGEMKVDEPSQVYRNSTISVIISVVTVLLLMGMAFAWYLYNRECIARWPSQPQHIQQVSDVNEEMQHAERSRRLVEDDIRKCLNAIENRIYEVEKKIRNTSEERDAVYIRNHDDVCRRVTLLSEQIAPISKLKANVNELTSRMDSMERRVSMIPVVPQRQSVAGLDKSPVKMPAESIDALNKCLAEGEKPPVKIHAESIDELKKRLIENEKEIKRLRVQNPACVLNTIDPPSNIRNTFMRMTTLKDKPYCLKAQTTYVRDLFYCTKCKSELQVNDHPCCYISRQKSFREWQNARRGVEETTKIKERIDALRSENERIKKSLDPK